MGDALEQPSHAPSRRGRSDGERTVLLVVHTGRDEATDTARRVEKVLGDNGIALRVLAAESVDQGPLHLHPDDMRALGVEIEVVDANERAAEGCELVLALGGDGTFLRAAELARNVEIPVLGVNLGHIGFLAEAEAEAIDTVLDHVINRDYRVEERMTLDVVVRVGGRIAQRGWALNEASLEKGPRLGVLSVVLEVDGRPVSSFGCDGVLVSTPDGLHGVRVLRGRADPLARPRGDSGGAQQRSRAVRAAHGDQSGRGHRHRGRRRRVRRAWCSATAAATWSSRRVRGSR